MGGNLKLEGANLRGAETAALMTPTAADGLPLCAEWLPYCSTKRDGWLLDALGDPFRLDGTVMALSTAQLHDVLTWRWVRQGQVWLTASKPALKLSHRRPFYRFCRAILFKFPGVLYWPREQSLICLTPGELEREHEWRVSPVGVVTHTLVTYHTADHLVHKHKDMEVLASQDKDH